MGDMSPVIWAEFQTVRGSATPWLYGPELALSLVSVLAIISNGSVIYVTVRSKSLRGTCNFLLAGTCLFELFHELSHFVALYNTTLGGNFIDFGTCLYIQLPFLGGLLAVQASLFATAVDRLIAVFAPIKYKVWNQRSLFKWLYLTAMSLFVLVFCAYTERIFYSSLVGYADTLTMCDTGELFKSGVNLYVCAINVIPATIYLLIWLMVRKNVQAKEVQGRILRSLVAIVAVNLGGYLGLLLCIQVTWAMVTNRRALWLLFQAGAVLSNCCVAANAPLLYCTSGDYRAAFNKHVFNRKVNPATAVVQLHCLPSLPPSSFPHVAPAVAVIVPAGCGAGTNGGSSGLGCNVEKRPQRASQCWEGLISPSTSAAVHRPHTRQEPAAHPFSQLAAQRQKNHHHEKLRGFASVEVAPTATSQNGGGGGWRGQGLSIVRRTSSCIFPSH